MDELTSKHGIFVKFGPTYSPWSNGLYERNHTSPDITTKMMMECKKGLLTDTIVKAALWIHNTFVNKLGYSPLQLVTRKVVNIPELTIGNGATESTTVSETLQRTMETIYKTLSEFKAAEMRT